MGIGEHGGDIVLQGDVSLAGEVEPTLVFKLVIIVVGTVVTIIVTRVTVIITGGIVSVITVATVSVIIVADVFAIVLVGPAVTVIVAVVTAIVGIVRGGSSAEDRTESTFAADTLTLGLLPIK